jgi:hypothetical protein
MLHLICTDGGHAKVSGSGLFMPSTQMLCLQESHPLFLAAATISPLLLSMQVNVVTIDISGDSSGFC